MSRSSRQLGTGDYQHFQETGIVGPTVKYSGEWADNRKDVNEPCVFLSVPIADNCLDCPLAVCKYDDQKGARAEIVRLIQEGKLDGSKYKGQVPGGPRRKYSMAKRGRNKGDDGGRS